MGSSPNHEKFWKTPPLRIKESWYYKEKADFSGRKV